MEIIAALAVIVALAYLNKWNEHRIDARIQKKMRATLGRDEDQR